MTNTQILLLLLPVIRIEIGLIIFALRDLIRPERHRPRREQADVGADHRIHQPDRADMYLTVGRLEE